MRWPAANRLGRTPGNRGCSKYGVAASDEATSDRTCSPRSGSPSETRARYASRSSGARSSAAVAHVLMRAQNSGVRVATRCASQRQLPVEPSFRERPLALDGGGRAVHDFTRFLDREPAEEPEFDDPRLPRIDRFELRE